MATIAEILSQHWPGTRWSIDEDDYATLSWLADNPVGKPTEAEIRALSAATDATIAVADRERRQQRAMVDTHDAFLKAFEIIVRGEVELARLVNDMRGKLLPQALSGTLTTPDSNVVNAVTTLRNRLQQIRDDVV